MYWAGIQQLLTAADNMKSKEMSMQEKDAEKKQICKRDSKNHRCGQLNSLIESENRKAWKNAKTAKVDDCKIFLLAKSWS